MADDDERPGRTRTQIPGQPADHLHVEMVGGLVEHQHVVPGQQNLGKRDPATLAAGQADDVGVEFDPGQQVLDDGAGLGFGRPDVVGTAVHCRLPVASLAPDHRANGGPDREVVGLAQISHRQARRVRDPPRVGVLHGGQHFQQRRLAVPVAADHTDRVALLDPQADSVEQGAGAVADRCPFEVDQVCHQRPMIGGACAMMT